MNDKTASLMRSSIHQVLEELNNLAERDAQHRQAPNGMSGIVEVVKIPDERCWVLGIDAALVLAVCRSIARTLRGSLPDQVQVAVSPRFSIPGGHPTETSTDGATPSPASSSRTQSPVRRRTS